MIVLIGRGILVTLALTIVGPLAALLLGLRLPEPVPGSSAITLGWVVASNAIIALTLVFIASRAAWRGWPLVGGLFTIAFGIGTVQALVEAWVFGVVPLGEIGLLFCYAAIGTFAASALTAWLARRDPASTAQAPVPHGLPRPTVPVLAAIAAIYTTAYFAAGILAYPFFGGFYEHRRLPPVLLVAALQLVVRGPLFGLLLAVLVHAARGSRMSRALLAGVAMSLLGGIAPLILPNPYFPDSVRWAHLVETSTSNFIFGLLAGWILARPAAETSIGARARGEGMAHREMNGDVSA
jgi:hypothetical protein